MTSKPKQHWLPRAYLRPFRAGSADTIFMLDLQSPPVWQEVGLMDVCCSRKYHASDAVDRKLDTELLNGYPTIIRKLAAVREHSDLARILDAQEVGSLLQFLDVHLMRNALSSYRIGYHVMREYLVLRPDAALPEEMPPQIVREIDGFRRTFDDLGVVDDGDREDVIAAWVHTRMEEDGQAHLFMRMPAAFDDMLLQRLQGPPIREFSHKWVLFGESPMYTMDNPFILSGSEDSDAVYLAPLTPHHLLACADAAPPDSLDPSQLLMKMPYLTFSTKLFASAPMDLCLSWGTRPPDTLDPDHVCPDVELGQMVHMVLAGIETIRR